MTTYSQYDYFGEYTRTVGTLCSLLYHTGISCDGIDRILSSAKLFQRIENEHCPLLLTSNEKYWMSIILSDKSLNDIIGKETSESLRNLNDCETDWLSMWAGDEIAKLAIRYDISMSDIVSVMSFDDFMQKSVALHAQPDEYVFSLFEKECGGKFSPKDISYEGMSLLHQMDKIVYTDDRKVIDGILSVYGLSSCMKLFENDIVLAAAPLYTEALIANITLFDDSEAGIKLISTQLNLEEHQIVDFSEYMNSEQTPNEDFASVEGIEIPDLAGDWSKNAPWLTGQAENSDRSKYLQRMMSYLLILPKELINDTIDKTEITVSKEEAERIAARTASYRSSYMQVPMRPRG